MSASPPTSSDPESFRDRTRRVVTAELIDVAQDLFVQHGYEAVTVDQIAAAAGMSKRTLFRYFPSKDALVLGKYDRHGEQFAAALAARPADEPVWEALRRMFDDVVTYISDPERNRRAREIDRVINTSETLRAGYLERMQRAQRLIVVEVVKRSNGSIPEFDAAALVAAAFAAMSVAHAATQENSAPLPSALDTAMKAITNGSAPAS